MLDTQGQIDALCDHEGWTEEELFRPMDGYSWEDQWEHNLSPEAQAFTFLQKHDLFPAGGKAGTKVDVRFIDAQGAFAGAVVGQRGDGSSLRFA